MGAEDRELGPEGSTKTPSQPTALGPPWLCSLHTPQTLEGKEELCAGLRALGGYALGWLYRELERWPSQAQARPRPGEFQGSLTLSRLPLLKLGHRGTHSLPPAP